MATKTAHKWNNDDKKQLNNKVYANKNSNYKK